MTHTRTPITNAAPYDLGALKDRGRISFDDDDLQLSVMGDAAAAEIERHCELALLAQVVTVTLRSWCSRIPLPVGPFYAGALAEHPITVELLDEAGTATPHPAGWWIEGGRYPVLNLTTSGSGVALRISYPAGYGMDAGSIPADLGLAIADQAAAFYDQRGPDDAPQGLSVAAARIAARHRRVAL